MSGFLEGKLDNQEIRQKLSKYRYASGFKPTKKLIDSIIEQFWFHDFYNSFISEEAFLKYLLSYLNEKRPSKFNRYKFYDYFFNQISKNRKARIILQQFSLVFEKLQTDSISISNIRKLANLANLPEKLFPVSWLVNKHLIKTETKEKSKYLIWKHHTLTEFLTTEHILQAKNPLEEFQKLAVLNQEGIVAFKPSWSGVLLFLLESSNGAEVLHWLIYFLDQYKDNIDDNLSELLAFVDINIPSQARKKVFDLIYNSYFDRIVWLPVWARSRIAKFVDEESYKRLKEDIKEWSNITETFVRRGNVVSVVEGLLENKSKLITTKEKGFWKKTLIEFANNPNDDGNGVLQRHSLAALAYFKNEKIIPVVAGKCFEETQDSLVRDEFIQFCINSSPNSTNTIDYLIKGIKKGSAIYARHGLYKITSKKAIEYLLSKISRDEEFLKLFLKHESIFDKEGADEELIRNTKKQLGPRMIRELKKLIFTVLRIEAYYKEGQSNFLRQIAQLIDRRNPGYIFEVLDDIKKEKDEQKIDRLFYDSKELLAILLTKDYVKKYFEVLEKFPTRTRNEAQYAIYTAKRINGDIGEQVYQEAIKLGFVQKVEEDQSLKYFEEQETKRKQEIYDSFVKQLEPSLGKYNPGVFKYFLQNKKDIEAQWKDKDKKRLTKIAIEEGIRKIDPRQFKVTIPDKSTRRFSWSSVASYYGDVLQVVNSLASDEVEGHKQQIIDFIPFAFSDDMSLILDLIPEVKDEDLTFVNKVMSNPKDDKRYLIPGSYVYIIGQYAKRGCKLKSVKSVLLSFIGDKDIPDYEQRAVLENLTFFVDDSDKKTKAFLKDVFEKPEDKELSKTANALLISVYKDEDSINWRFAQLKTPIEFDRRQIEGIEHSVGPEERELDTIAFAKPIIDLQDEKYLPNFFDLLIYSFKVIEEKKDKKYWDYVNYLWRIVIAFVENLKEKGSFKPLLTLEDWVSKNATYENSNWLVARIGELRKNYISSIGRLNIREMRNL